MQSSCEVPVTAAVRSLDSKVVVITPKQLAQLGIDKDIKSVCQRVRNGDGAFATGQSSGGLLNTLRVVDGLQISDVCKNQNARKKEIVILSNQVVHYSESEMKAMLNPEKPHVLNGTLGAKNVTGPEATNSKNPNFVPDRTPEKPTAAEGVSNCDTKPPSTSTKQSTVPWNQLIPSTFAKRFNVVKTYSKVNTISIVQKEETTTQTPKKPTAKIIKTIKMEDNAKTKPKEKVVEEAKTKDQEEAPVTPVAPKKRGRPRKTPLQPKVDEDSDPEPKEKPKKEVKEPPKPDQNNPAPRRRGRPRKVPVEPKPEEASSDEDSPVEKKRKTKKVEPKELSTPSAGTRTSGRKRKVVDYAALSGGRISSSEEEDFAEILAQEERSKKKTAKEEKEDSAEEEPEQEKKEVKSPKLEAVHPLKKRIKMEHAQAIEKEKLEDGKKEKDKNGEDEKMDTTEAVEEESSKTENSEEAKKPASENKVNDEDKRKTNENVKSNEKNDIVEANKEEVKTSTSLEEGKTTKPSQEEKSTKPSSEEEKSTKSSSEKETTTTKPSSGETTKPSSGETTTKLSSGETTKPSSGETTTKLSSGETTKPSSEEEKTTADGNQSTKPSSEGNEEGSKRVKEESSEIKCGVCEETMDGEASWVKHKLARHNDLAWKVGDKPLSLEDTNLVFKILTNVIRQHGTLSCLACGEDFTTVKKYSRHAQKCGESGFDASHEPPSGSVEPKRRGRKRKPNSIVDVIQAMVPTLAKSATMDNDESTDNKEWKPVVFGNEIVCDVCKEEMPKSRWSLHKLQKHNNLAWRDGEKPLDLNDHKLVQRTLGDLCKRKIPLRCETCGEKKKSVVGFLSHKTQCQKTNEEIEGLKVTCQLCGRSMLPVSMASHMVLSHSNKTKKNEPVDVDEVLAPRKAHKKAAGIIAEALGHIDQEKESLKSILKNVDLSCDEAVNYLQKDIDRGLDGCCVFMMCQFKSEHFDYLMEHITNKCPKRTDITYTCNFCLKTDRVKHTILEHVHQEHKDKTDEDFIIKLAFEDHDFKETAVDPMDFLDDKVDCMVMSGSLRTTKLSTGCVQRVKNRAAFLRHIAAKKGFSELFGEAYVWTMEFVQQNYINENNFPDVVLMKREISHIDVSEILNYLPKLKRSVDVSRVVGNAVINPLDLEHSWKNYRLFEAEIHDDGTSTIFCGGPVNALAWAPTPYEASDRDQILAVSALPDPTGEYRINERQRDKSLIQFWNFGNLRNNDVSRFQPKLAFCIAHRFGVVWSLEWCPSGCYDFCTPDDNVAKRLGLLAVATGDSGVYVYVVPQPDEIHGKILETKPKFKLVLSSDVPVNFGEMPHHPVSLSWTKAQSHSHIAVGYSNGFIGVFNLRNKDVQHFNEDGIIVIYPQQSFVAHEHSVTALSLNHLSGGNRWLVSGSSDKDLQFWDLDEEDLIYHNKRYPVSDLTWNIHWLSPVISHDYLTLYSSVQYPVRDCNGQASNFLPTSSRITSVTSSDWGNLFMQASDCGEVITGMPEQMHERFHNDKRRHIRRARFLASYTSFVKKDLSKHEMKAIERNRLKQTQGKFNSENIIRLGPNSYDECKNYGLVIFDLDSTTILSKDSPSTELDKYLSNEEFFKVHKPDLYPMQSVDKIALNPNSQSFLYYALGYHVGFVRVSIVRFLNSKSV